MNSRHGKHSMVRCSVCSRHIRSNNIPRHSRTHKDILSLSDEDARMELRARHTAHIHREERRRQIAELAHQDDIPLEHCSDVAVSAQSLLPPPPLNMLGLKDSMLQHNQSYLATVELGRQVAVVLNEGVICEESLTKERKDALDMYRKQRPRMDLQSAQLRRWQQDLLDSLKLSRRHVIWVVGGKGNEGKSWFQGYLETFYGYSRVVRLDICNKTSNIFHVLSQRPLQTTDVFLFNDTRSQSIQNYVVLESIKDGCATSSKYGSQILNFKTPNIVVVFSNRLPFTSNLSHDRWKICSVTTTGELQWDKGKATTTTTPTSKRSTNSWIPRHRTTIGQGNT